MKFLVVRLSSMGDVVLTTPIIRALKNRYPEAEVHFLTRGEYEPLVAYHPLLTAVHRWPPSAGVRATRWTGIIDLHRNLRTLSLRWKLRYERFSTFPKENLRKWLMVRLKRVFPVRHVVLRYGEALRPWGIAPEALGPLEVHIPPRVTEAIREELRERGGSRPWLAVGLGGTYETKRWPTGYFIRLLQAWRGGVILLGGPTEETIAHTIAAALSAPVVVGAGRYGLLETAAAIGQAQLLLSHDTGTAHLGAAMGTPVAVLWGNTVPAFGMYPWQVPHRNIEVPYLSCRPCSKLGFSRCPLGHHDCMRALTPAYVRECLHSFAPQGWT